VTVPGRAAAPVSILGAGNLEQMEMDLQGMFEKLIPKSSQTRRTTVRDARPILLQQEVDALIDPEKINQAAVELAQESGIVFIDEIDKVATDEGGSRGPDVSRQGGRFPIRVEMHDLARDDFARILREPRASLLRQYEALLGAEGVALEFADDAIEAMADLAFQVNRSTQNIGARRLHTILERVLEDISFEAPDRAGERIVVDADLVRRRLEDVARDEDLSRYIL
ncbi:hypothetical protein HK102_012536, partial [Quaeritorhiza haematococci]